MYSLQCLCLFSIVRSADVSFMLCYLFCVVFCVDIMLICVVLCCSLFCVVCCADVSFVLFAVLLSLLCCDDVVPILVMCRVEVCFVL